MQTCVSESTKRTARTAIPQPRRTTAVNAWRLDSYRPRASSFVVMSTDPAGVEHKEDIAEFVRLLPARAWGESLDAAQHMAVLYQSLQHKLSGSSIGMSMVAPFEVFLNHEVVGTYDTEEEADEHYLRLRKQLWPERFGAAPAAAHNPHHALEAPASTQRPFALGSTVTDRDGSPTALCRALKAPYWICVDGIVIADYGDDEEAAEAHYSQLVKARREALGITGTRMVMA